MAYAFSTPVLSKWVRDHFSGEWKYLHKALFEMPVERANLALLEFATQFRLLDDLHKISDYFKKTDRPPLGKVIKQDGTEEPLYFRERLIPLPPVPQDLVWVRLTSCAVATGKDGALAGACAASF